MIFRFSTDLFHLDKEHKQFSAEMSTLEGNLGRLPLGDRGSTEVFQRLYNDACDVGLILVSNRTKEEATWVAVDVSRDDEDIHHWILHPTSEAIRKHPRLEGYTMIIFND